MFSPFPLQNATGVTLSIPMPGHSVAGEFSCASSGAACSFHVGLCVSVRLCTRAYAVIFFSARQTGKWSGGSHSVDEQSDLRIATELALF